MGTMAVLDLKGDTKLAWDKNNLDQVRAAKEMFQTLSKKGYTAFALDETGNKTNTILREFDPNSENVVMIPKVSGG